MRVKFGKNKIRLRKVAPYIFPRKERSIRNDRYFLAPELFYTFYKSA